MNTKMKTIGILLVAIVAGSAFMMIQAQAEDANVPSAVPPQAKTLYKQAVAGRWRLVQLLTRNGEPTTLADVKIVAYDKGLLVLSNGVNIIAPGKWVKDSGIVSRDDLLKGLVGQTITIEALKLEYTNKYTATIYFAYKIGSVNALLPWNITPKPTA